MVAMGKRMELLVGLVLYILVADQSGQARGAASLICQTKHKHQFVVVDNL